MPARKRRVSPLQPIDLKAFRHRSAPLPSFHQGSGEVALTCVRAARLGAEPAFRAGKRLKKFAAAGRKTSCWRGPTKASRVIDPAPQIVWWCRYLVRPFPATAAAPPTERASCGFSVATPVAMRNLQHPRGNPEAAMASELGFNRRIIDNRHRECVDVGRLPRPRLLRAASCC